MLKKIHKMLRKMHALKISLGDMFSKILFEDELKLDTL